MTEPVYGANKIKPDWVMWGVSDGTQGLSFLWFSDHPISGEVNLDVERPETEVLGWNPETGKPWITHTGVGHVRGADASFRMEAPADGPNPTLSWISGEDYAAALENILHAVESGQMKPTGFLKAVCDEVATARSLIRKLDEEGSLRPSDFTEAEHVLLEKCQPKDES